MRVAEGAARAREGEKSRKTEGRASERERERERTRENKREKEREREREREREHARSSERASEREKCENTRESIRLIKGGVWVIHAKCAHASKYRLRGCK